METEFFDESWLGKVISFTGPNTSWRLTGKLRDKNDQFSAGEMKHFPDAISGAYGTFRCQNVHSIAESAIMRIAMQIPHAGAKPDSFTGQASGSLPSYGQLMLDAYGTLQTRECRSAPRLLNMKRESQDHTGMLPGGSILYLLIEKAPGEQLDSPGFWGLGRRERDRIRQAFKAAWEECVAKGYRPYGDVSSLFWDSSACKMSVSLPFLTRSKADNTSTIYNFMTAYPTEPHTEWFNVLWIVWGLAKAPDGYRWWVETEKDSDMRRWTF
ncbi:hypothetical protein BDV38DRAFT_277709 [Aspergillus pseudotamarii]|uniref:Uncharacterized protein n=1 Tax=Aspergillus pseudotamarii TaxID=132259 RepID=A0A5N6T9D1_ASPPS|nr:uncharacterized protein BDV38DRAFT_277709 [Aspergillus pseudotamarii]KAE8142896.1 hypothetical protein BDV38DRAFT_277709 [Aspergillus pseudotamarii]